MGVRLSDFQQALHAQVPELPGREWALRPESLAQQMLHQEMTTGRPRPELVAVVSARLRQITAATGRAGLATRWSTGRARPRLRTRAGAVAVMAASADGSALLFAGQDDALWQWSPASGAGPPRLLGRCGHQIHALALTPDGRTAVTGDASGAVCLWSPGAPDPGPVRLDAHRGFCRGVALGDDGGPVVSVGDDGRVLCRPSDGSGGTPGSTVLGTLADELPTAVAVLGGHVVTAGRRGRVHLLSLTAPGTPALLGGHESGGSVALAVARRRGLVVSLGRDNRILAWSPDRPGTGPRTLGGYGLPLWGLAVAHDESCVVSGGADGQVMAWPFDGGEGRVIQRHERSVTVLTSSAGPPAPPATATAGTGGTAGTAGTTVYSGGNDGLILWWESERSADSGSSRPADTWAVTAVDPARRVVTGGRRGIHVWDLTDPAGPPRPEAVLGDAVANALALLDRDGPLVWIAHGGELMLTASLSAAGSPGGTGPLRSRGRYDAVCAHPDRVRFLAAGREGEVELWDSARRSAEPLGSHGGTRVRAVAVSPDGNWAVTTGHDRQVLLWDLTPARNHRVLGRLQGRGRCLAVAGDGLAVYSGDDQGRVERWSPGAAPARTLVGRHRPGAVVRSVAVLPGGHAVASTADGGSVRLWSAAPGGPPVPLTRLAMTHTPLRLLVVPPGGLLVTDYGGGLTRLDVLGAAPAEAPPDGPVGGTAPGAAAGPAAEPAGAAGGEPPRLVLADQWWLRQQHPRPDLMALHDALAGRGPVEALLCCPDLPELAGFRQAMTAGGWTVETVPADRPAQRDRLLELARTAAARGPVVLVSGDEALLASLARAGVRAEVLSDLSAHRFP
ncbi:WD40 repeat domain-containing protein [Streptomyces sp. YIM 98790]|uniref:WD40 repeat domain-containing protein n=1 Tax=Streptomyces sp. YIM 98790 TaxID=2689077 RepID=UPI00140D0A60|nr:hypothetical protein [Streptomyces sp. YIM 98790]